MIKSWVAGFKRPSRETRYGDSQVFIDTKNNIVKVLNSLGNRCSRPAYCGYIENRSFNTFASYIANTPGGQPSIGLVVKK